MKNNVDMACRLLVLTCALLLHACGGGGNQPVPVPVFTSPASVDVPENTTDTVYVATADVVDAVTFSLSGGPDLSAFQINAFSGELSFVNAPDFEAPVDSDADNSYEVEIQAFDFTNFASQLVTVTVTDVNDLAPVFTSANSINVPEGSTTTGYTATATDGDGNAVTFDLSGGADRTAFNLDGGGNLSFAAVPDFEAPADDNADNSYEVEISASDGANSVALLITVSVTDIIFSPIITSGASVSTPEGITATGYTATATHADGDSITFSLSGGSDQTAFSIDDTTGVLSFAIAPDFEAPADGNGDNAYEIEISATDGVNTAAQAVTVTVTNVNDVAPIITSGATVSVPENTAATGYTATAADAEGDPIEFGLSGGADQAALSIDENSGVLSFDAVPDFDAPADNDGDNVYEIEISVNDGANSVSQTLTVTVTNVNDIAPVFTRVGNIDVDENNTATGYTAVAGDAEGDAVSYTLSGGADQAAFSIGMTSGVLSFNSAADFEGPIDSDADNVYEVEISASDDVNSTAQAVLVTVIDIANEFAPVFTSGTSINVPEGSTATGYTATASDGDGDTITYSLSGGTDQSAFNIDDASGVLTFDAPTNFDTPIDNNGDNDYEVEISASDSVSTVAQTITVTVTDDTSTAAPVAAATPTLEYDIKTFRFIWNDVADATFYRLLENPDGVSGFNPVGHAIVSGVEAYDHFVALYLRFNASYILQSCNVAGCVDSSAVAVTGTLTDSILFLGSSDVPSEVEAGDRFGWSVAISGDGSTLAVGAYGERSSATGANGDDTDNSLSGAGAVYIFTRSGNNWAQQAYLKASNTDAGDRFGFSLSLSESGNTLAVGADRESSIATGVGGDETNNGASQSGAVYLFSRTGSDWAQQAYIKASNTNSGDAFGWAVSLSGDSDTLAVSARYEASNATGINGDDTNNDADNAGAVYVFARSGSTWMQQAYVKGNGTEAGDLFGFSVSLNTDGNTLAAGARGEDSDSVTVNGDEDNNDEPASGAAYVFARSGTSWTQQAFIKADNAESLDRFGYSVGLSGDGDTLAVGAYTESSNATGVGGNGTNNDADGAGAVYVFARNGTAWQQQAYVKASNTDAEDEFGSAVGLSDDGNILAVGAPLEDSRASGINGDESNNDSNSGAVYVFARDSGVWMQQAYVKSVTGGVTGQPNSQLGYSLSISADGQSLAAGAHGYFQLTGAVSLY